jgi:hypothetical protein
LAYFFARFFRILRFCLQSGYVPALYFIAAEMIIGFNRYSKLLSFFPPEPGLVSPVPLCDFNGQYSAPVVILHK